MFGKFDIGQVPVNVKLGRHTVFWGEAMLNPVHSLSYGQSALDLGKLFSVPGTEAKELFLPREAVSLQVQATPELSFAGQYFFDWEQARIPEAGSFLGFNDHLLRGGESFIFGAAAVTAANPLGVNRLVRGEDSDPDKHRRLGHLLALEPAVARRHARRLLPRHRRHPAAGQRHPGGTSRHAPGPVPRAGPGAAGRPTTCYINPSAATVPEVLGGTIGRYAAAYADDIKIYGLSLSKNLWGVSIGADLNYRENMPLLSDTVSVLPASFAPLAAVLPPGSLFAPPAEGESGGARGTPGTACSTASPPSPTSPVWDSANLIVELIWNHWSDVNAKRRRLQGSRQLHGRRPRRHAGDSGRQGDQGLLRPGGQLQPRPSTRSSRAPTCRCRSATRRA